MSVIVGIQAKRGPPRMGVLDYWEKAEAFGDDFNGSPCMYLPNKPIMYGPDRSRGYVRIYLSGRGTVFAHRWIYEGLIGPVRAGLVLDHLCRNRACVNPQHLEQVSNRENILRGIGLAAVESKQTHCKRGHEFSPDNTYRNGLRGRGCLQCKRDSGREWMRAKRARR